MAQLLGGFARHPSYVSGSEEPNVLKPSLLGSRQNSNGQRRKVCNALANGDVQDQGNLFKRKQKNVADSTRFLCIYKTQRNWMQARGKSGMIEAYGKAVVLTQFSPFFFRFSLSKECSLASHSITARPS